MILIGIVWIIKRLHFHLNKQRDEIVGAEYDDDKVAIKTDSESAESDSETEHALSAQSPVSGSVHYFIAPLDSCKAQDMMIEELNQVSLHLCDVYIE